MFRVVGIGVGLKVGDCVLRRSLGDVVGVKVVFGVEGRLLGLDDGSEVVGIKVGVVDGRPVDGCTVG